MLPLSATKLVYDFYDNKNWKLVLNQCSSSHDVIIIFCHWKIGNPEFLRYFANFIKTSLAK